MLREKLLSGKLKKHSEQLNKFVAGFFDTDGCVGIALDKRWVKVYAKITQAASKDPDFEVMRALQKHYNIGYITYSIPSMENAASFCDWVMNINDCKKLFNIIGKHLLVKYYYYKECIFIYDELACTQINRTAYEELREYFECFKKQSSFPRVPKHLSYAYTSGALAGDGHFRCVKRGNRNELNIEIHNNSEDLVAAFKQSFRGTYLKNKPNCFKWRRNLGSQNRSFALDFLPKIRKSMLLITKRNVIDRMLSFHEPPAETKQDGLFTGK